jgi:hypothetical protein
MNKLHEDHFVADGDKRAWTANYDAIREQVEREYEQRLAVAGLFRRWQLRWKMRREIERRLDRVAPPWGLYLIR